MTFREWAEKYCVDRGMFPDQAKEVVDMTASDNAVMAMRWNGQVEGCPQKMLVIMAMEINHHALALIDAKMPKAWFRPMFEPIPVGTTHRERCVDEIVRRSARDDTKGE